MKAIKVLFAVILTATLGLMTSCGGGGGGGGGGDSSALAPEKLDNKTMTWINNDDSQSKHVYHFENGRRVILDVGSGTLIAVYDYEKISSTVAQLTIKYNMEAPITAGLYFQEKYTFTFESKDTASARIDMLQGSINNNGVRTDEKTQGPLIRTATFSN